MIKQWTTSGVLLLPSLLQAKLVATGEGPKCKRKADVPLS